MGIFVNFIDINPPVITRTGVALVLLAVAVRVTHTSVQWDNYNFGIHPSLSPYRVYQNPIGPTPFVRPWNYDFSESRGTFLPNIDLKSISEFNRTEFEQMILLSLPMDLRDRLRPYLKMALENAQRFNVDPFWVLAIMWTESHFNPEAVSPVRAIGLMQVMPGTSHYLIKKMKRPMSPKLAYKMAAEPSMNIKMGAFYLSMLLKKFDGNHRLATVAYNMGPYRVKRRLRQNLPVGVRNHYLNKVSNNYRRLVQYADKYF